MRHRWLVPSTLAVAIAFALLAGSTGLLGACARVLARRDHLVAGDHVPDLEGRDQDGARVPLSRYRGRPLVVYFYPRDRTSGCTIEAHEFRTEYVKFKQLGVEVLGVSNDDVASHREFCTQEALPFPLLADPDQTFARAFGVRSIVGLYQRITFVLDGNGVVRQVFDPVHPTGHAREVLAAVQGLAVAAPR